MSEISAEMEEGALSQNAEQKNLSYIHLVVFEKGVKTCYYERCEVRINKHKIYVTPDDKKANKLWRTIDNNFIKHDKIICFFSSINGFALIFDHKKHCRRVYGILEKRRVGNFNSYLSDSTFERRFVVTMIKELHNYCELDFAFVLFILKLLRSLEVEQKQRLAGMIIETGIEQELLDRVLKGIDLSKSSSKKPKHVDKDESREDNDKRRFANESSTSNKPKLLRSNDNQSSNFSSSLPKRKRVTFGVNNTEYFDD